MKYGTQESRKELKAPKDPEGSLQSRNISMTLSWNHLLIFFSFPDFLIS
jgi:hypothetical protein